MVERACERTGGRAALCARGRLCGWGGDLEWNGWLGGRWERVRTGRVGGAVVVVVGGGVQRGRSRFSDIFAKGVGRISLWGVLVN